MGKGGVGDRGPFELLQLLGTGGFGHTYRARVLDPALVREWGEEVAIKIPLNKRLERVLISELIMCTSMHMCLRQIQDRNIVQYLGFEEYDGKYVMVMEYVKGGSLRDLLGPIGRQKPLDLQAAVEIASGVLEGLAVIHGALIFHRDVKPENILLDGRVAKIGDLGLARMLRTNEAARSRTGTIYYMAPEVLGERGGSFHSDLWSLGVTFYEMVAGRLPFGEADTPVGTLIDAIRNTDPAPVQELRPEVPQPLSTVIGKALERDPDRRYKTAAEMLAALRRLRRQPDDRLAREMAAIRELMCLPGQSEVAEERLRALVQAYPGDARPHQYLGEYYNQCQRYSDAVAAFGAGLRLDAEWPLMYWNLALSLHRLARRRQAIEAIDKAISLGLEPSLLRYASTLLQALKREGSP